MNCNCMMLQEAQWKRHMLFDLCIRISTRFFSKIATKFSIWNVIALLYTYISESHPLAQLCTKSELYWKTGTFFSPDLLQFFRHPASFKIHLFIRCTRTEYLFSIINLVGRGCFVYFVKCENKSDKTQVRLV